MPTASLEKDHTEEIIMAERANHHCFYCYYLFPAKYSLSIMSQKV